MATLSPAPASSPATLSFRSSSLFTSTSSFPVSLHFCSPAVHRPSIRASLAPAAAADLPVLSFSGDPIGTAPLSLRSAPPSTARAVVHRALVTDRRNARRGTASTLTRGEVSGGGKKPYSQKKTGRARRGSQRTPLRPGGGVIFGPKPRDWSIKINRKEKRLAIATAISSAAAANDAFVVDDFDSHFAEVPKTREFIAAMKRWGLDPKQKAMFFMTELSENVEKSGRNIGTVKMLTPRTLNLFDILDAQKLVFTRSGVEYLKAMYGFDAAIDDDDEQEDDVKIGIEEGGGVCRRLASLTFTSFLHIFK